MPVAVRVSDHEVAQFDWSPRRGKKSTAKEGAERRTRAALLYLAYRALESPSFGSRGPARCILICTLTDSFPILIYKQITPLFKFPRGNTRRRSPELPRRFRAVSKARVSPRVKFFVPRTTPSPCRSPAKSPLVILSLKNRPLATTLPATIQFRLCSQCSLVISTASSCASNLLLRWRRPPSMTVPEDPPLPLLRLAPNLARICMQPFPGG